MIRYIGFDKQTHDGVIVAHQDVAGDIYELFDYMKELMFPLVSVIPVSHPAIRWDDLVSMKMNNTSCFNYRVIEGTDRLSWHARGLAIDINPFQNPYIRFNNTGHEVWRAPTDGVYDISTIGTLYANHPVVIFLKKKGWKWGGDWGIRSGKIDYQHFEKHLSGNR